MSSLSQDAEFFALMHGVVMPPRPELASDDRRRRRRNTFPTVQRVAPYVEGQSLGSLEFQDVQCQDLSTTGISFLTSTPPTAALLVVELTSSNRLWHLTAEVCHRREVNGSQTTWLIGCRFLGRVEF